MKAEQLSFATPDIYTELRIDREKKKAKRRWEDHFQKWSNEQSQDGTQPFGNLACWARIIRPVSTPLKFSGSDAEMAR